MAEIEIQTGLRENTIGAIEQFAAIASTDPIVAIILLVGSIITAVSIGIFGILTLGAVLGFIKRGLSSSEAQPQ